MQVETTADMLSWQHPSTPQLISSGVLLPGTRMILFGKAGIGKSMAAMDLAFQLSVGGDWMGLQCCQCSVMVVQVEVPKAEFQVRLAKYVCANALVPDDSLTWATEPYFKISAAGHLGQLKAVMDKHKPQVLILDPIYKMIAGDISKNDNVQRLLDDLDLIQAKHNTALVLIGHTRKLNTSVPLDMVVWEDELIGGKFFINWCDTAVVMLPDSKRDRFVMDFRKVRHAATIVPTTTVWFDRSTLRYRVV